jgi:twitching motility protein PilT
MDIKRLLKLTAEKAASDLHLVASAPPVLRVNGILGPLEGEPALTVDDLANGLSEITNPEQAAVFKQEHELDFAYALPGVARFRANASLQMGGVSLVFRLVREQAPSINGLGLPRVCMELALRPRGLVLCTGPTGSGKSTTLAAMIEYLNQQDSRRVVTIEDPIEFVYTNQRCLISQREVGRDTHSFAAALRHVLRQNPDVILVGEMRDTETAAAALTAAETGHLVLSTGHAPSADQTIERIIDMFPPHQHGQARSQLASVLEGILCQVLAPGADGRSRAVAVEVLLANMAVRNLIREGREYQLQNVIRTSADAGMLTLDRSLAQLCRQNRITRATAMALCRNSEEFQQLLLSPEPALVR